MEKINYENTYDKIFDLFSIPEKLSKPIEFELFDIEKYNRNSELNYLPVVINFGPTGSGKSLACNYLLRESVQYNKIYPKHHVWFTHSVKTSEIKIDPKQSTKFIELRKLPKLINKY